MYPWGYADNYPNTDDRSCFNIEWAVDAGGNPVSLPAIHFVKVYNGVNQYCGWLGESSTEIMGAEDLHLLGDNIDNIIRVTGVTLNKTALALRIGDMETLRADVAPANAGNRSVQWSSSNTSVAEVTVNGLVFAKANGEAVITVTTGDGGFKAFCVLTVGNATGRESVEANHPKAYYAKQTLYLSGLAGYDCTVVNIQGQAVAAFKVHSPEYDRSLPLPAGVYILLTEKNGIGKRFKLSVQ
jgi:hypothetical protein